MSLPNTTFLESTRSMPLLELPVRTLVLQLDSARILFSPGSMLTPAQLSEAGAVTDIVAPSLLHTAGMKAAAQAHPSAKLWGPQGVREKLPELKWHGILGVDAWPFERELPFVTLGGMPKMNESVFFHRASKALLVTDLAFNIADARGVGPWIILSLFGTYRRFGMSRLFLTYAKDRRALSDSVAQIAALDFAHVVPSHGALVMNDGKARLLNAFRERKLM